jgi:hypothetical protein
VKYSINASTALQESILEQNFAISMANGSKFLYVLLEQVPRMTEHYFNRQTVPELQSFRRMKIEKSKQAWGKGELYGEGLISGFRILG